MKGALPHFPDGSAQRQALPLRIALGGRSLRRQQKSGKHDVAGHTRDSAASSDHHNVSLRGLGCGTGLQGAYGGKGVKVAPVPRVVREAKRPDATRRSR